MARAARDTDSIATGHACDATSTIVAGLAPRVKINGLLAAVKGDAIAPHTILVGTVCVGHSAVVNAGSSKVRFHGIPASRKGDSADAGSITGHSDNVDIGG